MPPKRRGMTLSNATPALAPTPQPESATPDAAAEVGTEVPTLGGTTEGTSGGTNGVTRQDVPVREMADDDDPNLSPPAQRGSLDVSLAAALGRGRKKPEEDWVKSGTHMLRYHHAALATCVQFHWQGYTSVQAIVRDALAEYLPDDVLAAALELAREGKL